MPLELGDVGYLDEEPLSGSVFEARLQHAQLHRTARMHEDLRQLRLPPRADLPIDALAEVENTGYAFCASGSN